MVPISVAAGLRLMEASKALVDAAALAITVVYVLVELLLAAVITVVMVFAPTFSGIAADAEPPLTGLPLTNITAVASTGVGVTVIEAVV